MTNSTILPIQEMFKGLNALRLECPASVVDDVIKRVISGVDAAREDEAGKFAEWIDNGNWWSEDGLWSNEPEWQNLTATQLYQLYKKQNP